MIWSIPPRNSWPRSLVSFATEYSTSHATPESTARLPSAVSANASARGMCRLSAFTGGRSSELRISAMNSAMNTTSNSSAIRNTA